MLMASVVKVHNFIPWGLGSASESASQDVPPVLPSFGDYMESGIIHHVGEEIIPDVSDVVVSVPSKDKCKIVNIYVDPNTKKNNCTI